MTFLAPILAAEAAAITAEAALLAGPLGAAATTASVLGPGAAFTAGALEFGASVLSPLSAISTAASAGGDGGGFGITVGDVLVAGGGLAAARGAAISAGATISAAQITARSMADAARFTEANAKLDDSLRRRETRRRLAAIRAGVAGRGEVVGTGSGLLVEADVAVQDEISRQAAAAGFGQEESRFRAEEHIANLRARSARKALPLQRTALLVNAAARTSPFRSTSLRTTEFV